MSHTTDRKVIVFGAGYLGQQFVREANYPVDYFADNDEKKHGTVILGKTVISPKELRSFRDNLFIIVANKRYNEIAAQLRELGYIEDEQFVNVYAMKEWAGIQVRDLIKRYINQEPEALGQYDLASLYAKVEQEYTPYKQSRPLTQKIIHRKPADIIGQLGHFIESPPRGVTFLLHGSQADGTYTAFSDIDDIVILNSAFFASFDVFAESITWLQRLNRYYQHYDITQHHGHWIFTYDELYNLNEAIMPACVFEESLSVFGDTIIEYAAKDASPFAQALMNTCDQVAAKLHDLYANTLNLYSLKHFVSSIALLMPLYYQSQGRLMTKRQAIHTALEQLDHEIADTLKWSSHIRSNWHKVPTFDQVEKFKATCAAFTNRVEVERYVSLHAPAIPAVALGIEGDRFYKQTSEMLQFFRKGLKAGK